MFHIRSYTILQPTIIASLFLLPLLGGTSSIGYEQIKVLFFYTINIVILTFVVISHKNIHLSWTPLKIFTIIFTAILLLSCILGVDPYSSILGRPPYFQGWILYLFLLIFSVLVSTAGIDLTKTSLALTLSSLIVSLIAIKDQIFLTVFNLPVNTYADRVSATFGQPNFYSGFILMVLPFNYFLIKKFRDSSTQLVFAEIYVLNLLAIFISLSRVAIFLSMILTVIIAITFLNPLLRKIMIFLTISVIILSIVSSYFFLSGVVWEELEKPQEMLYFLHQFPVRGFYFWQFDWSKYPEKRLYIWPVIGDLIIKKPILGYGLENLITEFPTSNLAQFHGIKDLTVDRSHNFILDLLFFSGALGLLSWLIILRQLFSTTKKGVLLTALLLNLIWLQFQNYSVAHLVFFYLLIGLIDHQPSILDT